MWLLELKSFRTKRRSSDSATWVAWSSILALIVVVGAVFTASQLAAMSHETIRFFNVRAPTLEDFRPKHQSSGVVMGQKSPFVHIGREYVTVGAVKSVLSPRPEADVVLIRKTGEWKAQLSKSIISWKRVHEVFPAPLFAISYEEVGSVEEQFDVVRAVVEELARVNQAVSGGKKISLPAPVFVGFGARRLAFGHDAGKE